MSSPTRLILPLELLLFFFFIHRATPDRTDEMNFIFSLQNLGDCSLYFTRKCVRRVAEGKMRGDDIFVDSVQTDGFSSNLSIFSFLLSIFLFRLIVGRLRVRRRFISSSRSRHCGSTFVLLLLLLLLLLLFLLLFQQPLQLQDTKFNNRIEWDCGSGPNQQMP